MHRNPLFLLFLVMSVTTLHAGLVATDYGWRKEETGEDHDAPFAKSIDKPARLIAPGGQTLTLAEPVSYNLMAGGRLRFGEPAHTLFMAHTAPGTKSKTAVGIRRGLPIEDSLRVRTYCEKADFEAFWKRTLEEQEAIPLDLKIEKVRDEKEHAIYKFNFAGLLGYRCYGWLSVPENWNRPMPGVLVLPPAGNRGQAVPIFPNAVGMAININGQDVDAEAVEYDRHTWPAPYLVTGILDKDHYSLRFGYAALVRAAELGRRVI